MQYETCRHVKEDGAYCGSPALRDHKYCHYHFAHRARRFRRARALRDNIPYQLDLPPLEDLVSVQVALSETVHALGAGQLDHRIAGKILNAVRQTISVIKLRHRLQAEQSANSESAPAAANSCVQDCSQLEQEFGIKPGMDIDAETALALQEAEELAPSRSLSPLGNYSPDFVPPENGKYSLADANQMLQGEVRYLEQQLRHFRQQERDRIRKEAQSATVPPECLATSA